MREKSMSKEGQQTEQMTDEQIDAAFDLLKRYVAQKGDAGEITNAEAMVVVEQLERVLGGIDDDEED
jgi:hypothetical protein